MAVAWGRGIQSETLISQRFQALVGASNQVGSASFRDPMATLNVAKGIEAYCERKGLQARELTGKAIL